MKDRYAYLIPLRNIRSNITYIHRFNNHFKYLSKWNHKFAKKGEGKELKFEEEGEKVKVGKK
jgi:hypothetical protein